MKLAYFLLPLLLLTNSLLAAFEKNESWSKTMGEVFQTVSRESYFPVNMQPAMIKALDAFAHEVDEHSQFLGPDEYKELINTTTGNFYGIGVELGPKEDGDEYIMVLSVKPVGPAQKAGMERYDKIVAIDGTPVSSLSEAHCINKLKGDRQLPTVTLDVMREKKGVLKFSLMREIIAEDNCWSFYLAQQKILYCALSLFTQRVPGQLQSVLEKGLEKKPKGIIIDLRDNPGGVLKAAVECASFFLAKNTLVVSTKGRNNRITSQYHTQRRPLIKQSLPMIILVNQHTASSAEILAQSLKVHSKERRKTSPYIIIVGTPTCGKGSIQEVRPLSNNCALKITTGLYYLPDDSSIQGTGITPDFIIKQKYPQSAEMKLLEKLSSKENKLEEKKSDEKKAKRKNLDSKAQRIHALKHDYQVQCACNILQVLDLGIRMFPRNVLTHEKALSWLQENFTHPQSIIAQEL